MKEEEQAMLEVCSKATQTPRVVGEQQLAFLQFSNNCGRSCHQVSSERKLSGSNHNLILVARISAEVEKEEEPETGGKSTESATGGANEVPQPVTPDERSHSRRRLFRGSSSRSHPKFQSYTEARGKE